MKGRPKLPAGSQDFVRIRENRLCVDKTAHIARMAMEGDFSFLSRPRRFGKSLTG
jgi:hypothetical protein